MGFVAVVMYGTFDAVSSSEVGLFFLETHGSELGLHLLCHGGCLDGGIKEACVLESCVRLLELCSVLVEWVGLRAVCGDATQCFSTAEAQNSRPLPRPDPALSVSRVCVGERESSPITYDAHWSPQSGSRTAPLCSAKVQSTN